MGCEVCRSCAAAGVHCTTSVSRMWYHVLAGPVSLEQSRREMPSMASLMTGRSGCGCAPPVRTGGSMPSIHHDEVRDYGFADQALALRTRAGLTQCELAELLGVSARAIGACDGGLSYPEAARLKQLRESTRKPGRHAGCRLCGDGQTAEEAVAYPRVVTGPNAACTPAMKRRQRRSPRAGGPPDKGEA
jgi:hypothetical protein